MTGVSVTQERGDTVVQQVHPCERPENEIRESGRCTSVVVRDEDEWVRIEVVSLRFGREVKEKGVGGNITWKDVCHKNDAVQGGRGLNRPGISTGDDCFTYGQ